MTRPTEKPKTQRVDSAKCPESMEELEAWEKKLPLCREELLKQVSARKAAGTAKSDRDAARQLSKETGRTEEGIRTAVKRARKDVGSLNPPKGKTLKKLKKLSEKAQKEEIEFWKAVQEEYPKVMDVLKDKIGKTIADVAGELQDKVALRYKDHLLPDADGKGMTELLARRTCQAIKLIDPGIVITFGEEVEAITYNSKPKTGNTKRLKALEARRQDAGS